MNQNPYPYPPPNQPYGVPPQGYPPPGYPPQGGYAPQGPTAEDENNLNTLSICHFIYGGFMALGGLVGVIYVVLGVVLATASMSGGSAPGGPPPAAIGGIFAAFGAAISIFIWASAALVIYSGMSLKKRRRRTLSLVMACICCLNIPMGTALGVFTLVVLSRPGVKALYDRVAYYGS